MSIGEAVQAQMQEALKQGDKLRLNALRSMRTAFLNEMKKDGSDSVPDEVCIRLLRTLAKQRAESIEAFDKAGRAERAADERAELAIIESFVPSLADESTVRGWLQEAIAQSGATSSSDIGRVMGALMKAHKGELDGGLAKRLAAELLAD